MTERYSDEQLSAAIEALREPERFREAERRVAAAAPQLQQVLAAALAEGGWFDARARAAPREARRDRGPGGAADAAPHAARRGDRIGMLVGVAVGWELARELRGPSIDG